MATVKLFGNLRKYTQDSRLQVSGDSVRAVVDALCDLHPQLCEVLLEDGAIRSHYKITRNGYDVALERGLDSPVQEGDIIAIFSPIAGG